MAKSSAGSGDSKKAPPATSGQQYIIREFRFAAAAEAATDSLSHKRETVTASATDLVVCIQEVMRRAATTAPVGTAEASDSDSGYGLYVWPAARVLAELIWYFARSQPFASTASATATAATASTPSLSPSLSSVSGKRILEFGCGTALPGIVAAKCGAAVTLTDRTANANSLHSPHSAVECSLSNARTNAHALNSLAPSQCGVEPFRWGELSSPPALRLRQQNWDLIIGADIFFDTNCECCAVLIHAAPPPPSARALNGAAVRARLVFDDLFASIVCFGVPLLTVFVDRSTAHVHRLMRCAEQWKCAVQRIHPIPNTENAMSTCRVLCIGSTPAAAPVKTDAAVAAAAAAAHESDDSHASQQTLWVLQIIPPPLSPPAASDASTPPAKPALAAAAAVSATAPATTAPRK